MVAIQFSSPQAVARDLAKRAQAKRLVLNLSQRSLSARSGVSFGTLKKFEQTGKISLESLLKIAAVLGCLEDVTAIFKSSPLENLPTLDDLLKQKSRHRGRQ